MGESPNNSMRDLINAMIYEAEIDLRDANSLFNTKKLCTNTILLPASTRKDNESLLVKQWSRNNY